MRILHDGHLFLITGRKRNFPAVVVVDGVSVIVRAVLSVLVVGGLYGIEGTDSAVSMIDGVFITVGEVTGVLVLDIVFEADSEFGLCLQTCKWFLKSPLLRIVVGQYIQW